MSKTILAEVDGFTPVIDTVMKDTSLITAVVFGKIWRYCQMQNGVCQATLDKIADGVGLSRQSIIDHIKILEGKGYIEDTTPNLRNRPHTYRDTGKAGLQIGLSAVNDVYSETCSTISDVDSTINDIDSHSKPNVLEDSIKIEIKKEGEERKPVFIGYWSTLLEVLEYSHDTPPANLRRIAAGIPVAFDGGVLTVQHPNAEWAQAHFARTFTNMLQGLCPGGSVTFQKG